MLRLITMMTLLTLLGGCASKMVKEIPAQPVTKEPNTPFVFQPYYQSKRVGIDQQKVEHHSDFATIVSEAEYVFAPRKPLAIQRMQSVQEQSTDLPTPESNQTDGTNNEATSSAPALLPSSESRQSREAPNYVVASVNSEGVCKSIMCVDGSECGKIMVCGSEPCDQSKRVYYNCTGDNCGLTRTTTDIMDSAKYTALCNEFSDLYSCPNQTQCK